MDVADWNGDGRLDLIMGEPRNYLGGGNMTIAINVGTNEDPVFEYDYMMARGGYFVEWTGSDGHDAWHCCMPCVFDFDGDGRPDLLVGTESGRISLYSHDYFDGEKFPIFKAANFDRKQGNKVFRNTRFRKPDRKDKGPQYAQRPITETAGTIGGIPDGRRISSRNRLPDRGHRIVRQSPLRRDGHGK